MLEGLYHAFLADPDIRVMTRSTSAEQVLADIERLGVSVVMADMKSRDLDITETSARLRKQAPDVKLVAYGNFDPGPLVKLLLWKGVCTYFIKGQLEPSELCELITEVHHHGFYFTDVVTRELVLGTWAFWDEGAIPDFSEREEEVLRLICHGMNRKQVAQKLMLAEATVKYHIANLFEKSGVSSTQELLLTAIHLGWLDALTLKRKCGNHMIATRSS